LLPTSARRTRSSSNLLVANPAAFALLLLKQLREGLIWFTPRPLRQVLAIIFPMHALSLYSNVGDRRLLRSRFLDDTRALWRLMERAGLPFSPSVVVEQEIAGAPERVRALMRATFAGAALLPLSARQTNWDGLPRAKSRPTRTTRRRLPCRRLTVARLDYLVSWNFKHLANAGANPALTR